MIDIAATIEAMKNAGLDAEAIVSALACVRVVSAAPVRSAAASRQARYRARKASQSVTNDVTSVTRDAGDPLPSKEGPHTPKETQPTLPTTHKENPPKGGQKKASRLPSDWHLPDGWGADAIEAGLPAHLIDLEASKLRDWSLSSKNGAKLDWRATWRNWCREAAARARPRGSPRNDMDNLIDSLVTQMDNADARPPTETQGYQAAALRLPAYSR